MKLRAKARGFLFVYNEEWFYMRLLPVSGNHAIKLGTTK
jgi:hypothetical protein